MSFGKKNYIFFAFIIIIIINIIIIVEVSSARDLRPYISTSSYSFILLVRIVVALAKLKVFQFFPNHEVVKEISIVV